VLSVEFLQYLHYYGPLPVPGSIDEKEVRSIARVIAEEITISRSLLAFYPHFPMSDLPLFSRTHAKAFCFPVGPGLDMEGRRALHCPTLNQEDSEI
jgi:pyruvate-formate lyase-activating enzyme